MVNYKAAKKAADKDRARKREKFIEKRCKKKVRAYKIVKAGSLSLFLLEEEIKQADLEIKRIHKGSK